MIRSSFASFYTARSAIQANQSALAIVGQNMANVKTVGYTRQSLDLISMTHRGITNSFPKNPEAHIGSGVMITGVSQIRDPFLDTRYRLEMGNLGSVDKKVEILNSLGTIFDETERSAVKDQFSDLSKQLNTLMSDVTNDSNDSMVRSSSQTLVGMFRQYAKQLNSLKTDTATDLQNDVDGMNGLLTQIQELNKTIKVSQIHGNPALELQDQRNSLIDELSTYANISVTQTTTINASGISVDTLKIDMMNFDEKNSVPINLINDIYDPAQVKLNPPGIGDDNYSMSVTDTLGSIHDNLSFDKGIFQTSLSMINDSGEFDSPPTGNRGIGYYMNSLDSLVSTFAAKFNGLNTVNPTPPSTTVMGGPLFQTNDGSTKITAANITLSDGWLNGSVHILPSQDPTAPSGDNSNILNMINALKDKQQFKTPSGTLSFEGSFQECFSNMVNVQGMDQKSSSTILDNYLGIVKEISASKDSVSGVNIDEEGMNLLQYNSSLNAASRLMTTLDEALNTIINSMGVVGR